jgi:hypothetical protein
MIVVLVFLSMKHARSMSKWVVQANVGVQAVVGESMHVVLLADP